VLLLFEAGMEVETIFAALTRAWQAVFAALGLGGALAHWQQDTSALVTRRSLPAGLTYAVLYVGTSLLLLHLLLRNPRRTRWVAQLYAGLLSACVLLLLTGRLGGHAAWAYGLGRRLLDFIVSPLPVLLLIPLLWPARK